MTGAVGSVIIASAQSVAKVFVIGGVGYLAVLYPRKAPFLQRELVGTVARFTFHALTIPLIYSTIAIAVTIESIGNYWFVIVGAFAVMGVSYIVATLIRCMFGIPLNQDFHALRVAVTFPNIVALPILIFPSLCEFPVVYEGYVVNAESQDAEYLQQQCVAQSNTMVFCYFFSWSLLFWSLGNRQLMQAATKRHDEVVRSNEKHNPIHRSTGDLSLTKDDKVEENPRAVEVSKEMGMSIERKNDSTKLEEENDIVVEEADHEQLEITDNTTIVLSSEEPEHEIGVFQSIWNSIKQTVTSAGFIAMMAAFITACIPPLQKALFEGAGPLRFLGSALETLGVASSPISTMVVAASLVPPRQQSLPEGSNMTYPSEKQDGHNQIVDENPGMSDPNFGPYRRRLRRRSSRFYTFRQSLRSSSLRMIKAMPRSTPEMIRLHVWYCLSRLILTPAVIVGLIAALDCSGDFLSDVPNLAKLVIIVNAALPGALIVIVLLKSKEELSETAAAVAKVYLPSYLLSIISIAAWTAIGLWLTLPDENGNSICQR